MLQFRSSRLMAICCAMVMGLLAGCGNRVGQPTPIARGTHASQPDTAEPHGPAFVTEMLRLSFVGCVDRSGGVSPARHTLIHIRNVRCPTIWEFEAEHGQHLSDDELNRAYETLQRRLGAIQAEQAELICWCQRRTGAERAWFEEATDESLPVFRKQAADAAALQNDPGLRLRLGAVGRLLSAGLIDVQPLPDVIARDVSDNTAQDREAQEDALVKRIVETGERFSLIVLAGDHDLRDNLDRLANDDWEVLTVDVQAYVRFAPVVRE